MQAFYSNELSEQQLKPGQAVHTLKRNLDQSGQLFTYLVYFIAEVTKFAESDAVQKSSKHLPTEKDLSVNTKITGNEIIWKALENESFKKSVSDHKLSYLINEPLVKQTYLKLIETPEYQSYITIQRDKKSDKKILEFIFNTLMLPEDNFISEVEEKFINWDDDAEVMVSIMSEFIQKPASFNFAEIVTAEKWEFAKTLLETVIEKRDFCLELIKPKLKNWDADRIAALDMILMQMAVCELLYFETIPTKVTINEYIDIAKEYSTEQSGHFINGIIDNIHKELVADNKIHKKNFKNSTL